MYPLKQIKDHADSGVSKFLEQFKNKAFIEAWARSYLDEIQKLEDATFEVLVIRGIDKAEGVGLDKIGKLLGKARLGLSDVNYRVALRAQQRINRSSGTGPDLIAVTRLSIGSAAFTYEPAYPATVWIAVLDAPAFDILVLFGNLVKTKMGGVKLFLEVSTGTADTDFTFSVDDSEPTDLLRGMGDDLDPTIGGRLTDLLES